MIEGIMKFGESFFIRISMRMPGGETCAG